MSRASTLLRRLAASSERTLGAEHAGTIVIRLNCAIVELLAGNIRAATAQFMALQAVLHDQPRLAGYQHYVDHHLGLAHWVNLQYDDAVAHYLTALTACSNKENAWSLFRVVIAAPPTAVVRDALARIRSYVMSTDDAEAETWPVSCMTCYTPIVGRLVACSACPNGLVAFCSTCLERRPTRLAKFCAHDAEATAFQTTLPPHRYFLEDALLSQTASYADLDAVFGTYEQHCDAYKVSSADRLRRTAIPGYNHCWHPML
ncbi:hypothetical protein SDRG_14796 [Saprolegnia diclina VS20]|uniref:Uncharacterized protein n=1 Tax=Saprolegnia diclina (strain VS20) TaxID=1156394 RepID=T0PPI0_SAPDV|nr:hypothetical protein SDRG_14796 [Saprolegnia diclina VS20]EQC27354.1 hypothetical protein SDRG_14796 [Saprolegnia diclina VS20]|eukprot:XP_008619173.1 hypothetical protein SDRG_14796 [Saprolegnia diclina VS20]